MRCEDLVAPMKRDGRHTSGVLQSWALIISPQSRGEVSKTNTSDDSIALDNMSWLGPLLSQLTVGRLPQDWLFASDPAVIRSLWTKAMVGLGVSSPNMYQHRHGGASTDYLTKARPLLEVMARGRWTSTTTLLRYAKPGKL